MRVRARYHEGTWILLVTGDIYGAGHAAGNIEVLISLTPDVQVLDSGRRLINTPDAIDQLPFWPKEETEDDWLRLLP